MTGQHFAIFDTAIGALRHRLGAARHQCGATADGQRGQDPCPHPPAPWRHRRGAAARRRAARDRPYRRTARRQAGRSRRRRARSRRRAGIPPRRLRYRPHHSAGQDLTYGDIAKRLGGVELSRDVGQALGRNPCPIVVPCHRVLAAGGKPGGFSANGGVVTKLKMLAIEGAVVNHTPSLFD